MKTHRFFVRDPVSQGKIRLADKGVIHQMRDVFRLKKGHRVVLLDNTGFEYEAEIQLLTKDEVEFSIIQKNKNTFFPKIKINLVSAVTKKTFEWILEKGTELGVGEFTPLISERVEKRDINHERALKIIQESAEQSGKTILPKLSENISLKDLLEKISDEKNISHVIVLDFDGERFDSQKIIQHTAEHTLNMFVGPEGGWSQEEKIVFKNAGVAVYSLGPQILRAETAALAAVSLLLLN